MSYVEDLNYLCSSGTTNNKRTVADGFDFEEKIYTREDAIELERAGFARTQIFDSTALGGSRNLPGDDPGRPIVSIVPGVPVGTVRQMIQERYEAPAWQGELDGRLATQCAFFPGSSRRVVESERFMATKTMFLEDEICPREVIGTYKQAQLLDGSLAKSEDPGFLNRLVIDAFLEANHKNIDRHAWMGDYGAADPRVKHVDGFLKILNKATGSAQGQAVSFTFTGDISSSVIQGLAGGHAFHVDYDTDVATTLGNVVTFLQARKGADGNALYASVALNSTTITVEAQPGQMLQLQFVVGNTNAGIKTCPDGSIESLDPDSGVTVTAVQTQEAIVSQSPISLPIQAVNPQNVESILDAWYDLINDQDPEVLEQGFGLNLLVARNIWNSYVRATSNRGRDITGRSEKIQPMDYMGIRMIPVTYLPKNVFLAARPEDLAVGVDLVSDAQEFRTWIDADTNKIRYQGAVTLGFQVQRVDKVSGTFTNIDSTFGFHDEMPLGVKKTSRLASLGEVTA